MKKIPTIAVLVLAVSAALTGCGPAQTEKNTEVSANEVGYQYSLEGDTVKNQKVMNPTEYAGAKRIQAQTIIHSQRPKYHGFGWQWWRYTWIPTDAVAKVSLLPVTREWTQGQSFMVETLNSVGLSLGATTQLLIIPDKANRYLTRYGGKPLSEVADTVVWGYMVSRATMYFGKIDVEDAPNNLNQIAAKVHADAKKYFEEFGIDVATFGWVGGIRYDRQDIQDKLDAVFVAENDLKVADQNQQQVRKANAIRLQHARAERTQALTLWHNRRGVVLRTMLDLREQAIAADTHLVEKWNGASSTMIPSDRGVLWFLGQTGMEEQMTAIAKIAELQNPELDKLAADTVEQVKKENAERLKLEASKAEATTQPTRN